MKTKFIIVSVLLATATVNAAQLKCKIDPSILPETVVDVPNSPAILRAGQIGGVMAELAVVGDSQLEITVLEFNKEIAKTTGSASVAQTAKAITSKGSEVAVSCSPAI